MMTNLLRIALTFLVCTALAECSCGQEDEAVVAQSISKQFSSLKFRNIGPFRGGRSNAVCGVIGDSQTYYMGSTGGGVWKTSDAGINWKNISDGFLESGSVGAIAVAPSDPNVIYVGMGEHAVRGVMTSHGDGVYKSTDAGQTWNHIGLVNSRHIAAVRIHPTNPDLVYVAVQGSVYRPSNERGVYRSNDGGVNWEQILFTNDTTGASDLSIDANNPRILYAGMWDNARTPWQIRSGGAGSAIHKSIDGGTTWTILDKGLPTEMGKVAVDVSPANSNIVYANIEATKGGVFRSNDAGKTWKQVNSDRVTVARAWYYIEIFADPDDEDQVYVLNAPMLKSIDGGKTFEGIPNPHGDQHDLWINPSDPGNMILGNDGGGCITFNGGKSWSDENNQPTAQFYRVTTDNQFPYRVYGGQQDNSTVSIASRSLSGGISERDWFPTAGGESAFLVFDPNDPSMVFGTSIQGIIDRHDLQTDERKSISPFPQLNLGTLPKDQKYRFNWNGPLASRSSTDELILYHGGNVLLRSDDQGHSWKEISGDLTRNEKEKHGNGGVPFTDEAAGGEVYNTISYIAADQDHAGTIWVGTDDGLIHLTKDDGQTWVNITPNGLDESLVNAIDISPHDPNTAFAAVTRYKFDDLSPMAFKTVDGGKSWASIVNGIQDDHFVRVVRQDPINEQILYAGTEGGLYISFNQGAKWLPFQLNLPVCPITDLTFKDNDLVVATSGRAFWILDDLGSIQQSAGILNDTEFKIYSPKPSYKYSSSSASPVSQSQGQNPLNGVIFDYVLPKTWTKEMVLKLEVMDAAGKVIRTIGSAKAKNVKTWVGGPGVEPKLPANPGLNRFHWDLRTDQLPGVKNIFVLGSHEGPRVIPGFYSLRLSADQKDMNPVETEVSLLADPRNPKWTAENVDYQQQQNALNKVHDLAREIHQSVNRFRRVKTQLAGRLKLLKEMEDHNAIADLGRKALNQINAWELQLIQRKQKTFQDVINFPNKLNAELLHLAGTLDTNAPRPSAATLQRIDELDNHWQKLSKELESISGGSISEFNSAYKAADLPAVIIPKRD